MPARRTDRLNRFVSTFGPKPAQSCKARCAYARRDRPPACRTVRADTRSCVFGRMRCVRVRYERTIGRTAHYTIGIVFVALLLAIWGLCLRCTSSPHRHSRAAAALRQPRRTFTPRSAAFGRCMRSPHSSVPLVEAWRERARAKRALRNVSRCCPSSELELHVSDEPIDSSLHGGRQAVHHTRHVALLDGHPVGLPCRSTPRLRFECQSTARRVQTATTRRASSTSSSRSSVQLRKSFVRTLDHAARLVHPARMNQDRCRTPFPQSEERLLDQGRDRRSRLQLNVPLRTGDVWTKRVVLNLQL
jgi:hypothetical protein